MRWSRALCLGTAIAGVAIGCRNCDKVETELRAREEDVRILREELDGARLHEELLQRELGAMRGQVGPAGIIQVPSVPYPVCTVRLGRQTGGKVCDESPYHEALQVQVEPLDTEGQALKVPACLTVLAVEVTREGLKRPLSDWQVPADQLRNCWQSGLFTTGYVVTLPWRAWPCTDKLRVVARLQLTDGRVFEADKDITVRLPPENLRKPVQALAPVPPAPSDPKPGTQEVTPKPTTPAPALSAPPAPAPAPAPGPKQTMPDPVLPTPKVVPDSKTPPPPDPPPGTTGPMLTRGKRRPGVIVEMFRPIPLPPEP